MSVELDWAPGWIVVPCESGAGDARGERLVLAATRPLPGGGALAVRVSVVGPDVDRIDPFVDAQRAGAEHMRVRTIANPHGAAVRAFVPCDDQGEPGARAALSYVATVERASVLLRLERVELEHLRLAVHDLDRTAATVRWRVATP